MHHERAIIASVGRLKGESQGAARIRRRLREFGLYKPEDRGDV
jgi:hypothetical protein